MDKYRNTSKGGSGNKKMKKFPRILDFLEAYYKDVYDIIDDLAMHGALTPKRGGSITFLNPDKKYITKIRKMIESDNPEEATDMVSSLILLDLFESPSDFSEKQDDIPNMLGKKVTIKGISGNKVMIDDGELTINTEFKPFERQGSSKRGNLAVWDLKGEVRYEEAPKATFKYFKSIRKERKTEGSSETDKVEKLINKTVEEELESIRSGLGVPNNYVSPILNVVARILRGLTRTPSLKDEYLKARSLLTKHPIIDFYILLKTPDIFVTSKILEAYEAGAPDLDNNVNTVKTFFDTPIQGETAAVLNPSTLSALNMARDNEANVVLDRTNISTSKNVVEAYDSLDQTNTLTYKGTVYYGEKVYPDVLFKIFNSKKGTHLALDEAKYFIYRLLRNIQYEPNTWAEKRNIRADMYEHIFNIIKDCFKKLGDPTKSIISKQTIDSQDVYQTIEFWKEFGLHFPKSNKVNFDNEAEQRVIRGGAESLSLYSKDLIDVDKEIENRLDDYDNSDFTLSDKTIRELKAYLKANDGKFPEI